MKKILYAFAVTVGGLALILGLRVWDSAKNRGLTIGYYGDFNAIVQALEEMPGIGVMRADANHDITLEEISITIMTDRNVQIRLNFGQSEPFRDTRGQKLAEELRRRIDEAISNKSLQSMQTSRID